MRQKNIYKTLFFIIAAILLTACTDKDGELQESLSSSPQEGYDLSGIMVVMPDEFNISVTSRDGEELDGDDNDYDPTFIIGSVLEDKFYEGKSILFISQLGKFVTPDFLNVVESNDNIYLYKYQPKPERWDKPNWLEGYNFFQITKPMDSGDDDLTPDSGDDDSTSTPEAGDDNHEGNMEGFNLVYNVLDWDDIKNRGSVGTGFTLFAMYFPGDQQPKFYVQDDQSTLEKLQLSDIMGAVHSTSSLYTRLRFRLFHLMTYFRVTLYVPMYETEIATSGDAKFSGFARDGLKAAKMLGIHRYFEIFWRSDVSSDTSPVVQLDDEKMDESGDINMYLHPFAEGGKTPTEKDVIRDFDVRQYYKDGTIDKDNVYKYEFSVIFPAGQFDKSSKNIMEFNLETVMGVPKTYYFDISNTDLSVFGTIAETGGQIQHLELYLPRSGSAAVLLNANVVPWTEASTNLGVNMQPGTTKNPTPGGNSNTEEPEPEPDPENNTSTND